MSEKRESPLTMYEMNYVCVSFTCVLMIPEVIGRINGPRLRLFTCYVIMCLAWCFRWTGEIADLFNSVRLKAKIQICQEPISPRFFSATLSYLLKIL